MNEEPTAWKIISGLLGPFIGAALGRIINIGASAQVLTRRRIAFVEFPTTCGVAVIAWGLSEYFSLPPGASAGVGVFCGYLGIRVIDLAVGAIRLRHDR